MEVVYFVFRFLTASRALIVCLAASSLAACGGGGAGALTPPVSGNDAPALTATNAITASATSAPVTTQSTAAPALTGTISAMYSTDMSLLVSSACGHVDAKYASGFKPSGVKAGDVVSVWGTVTMSGSCPSSVTNVTAVSLAGTTSSPAPTSAPTAKPTAAPSLNGTISALYSRDMSVLVSSACGHVDATFASGFTPSGVKVGDVVSMWGTVTMSGSCPSSVTNVTAVTLAGATPAPTTAPTTAPTSAPTSAPIIAPTAAPTSAPAPGNGPLHVNSAAYVSPGDNGYTGAPSALAPYITWAIASSSNAAAYQAAGVKVYAYTDPNRAYASYNTDNAYTDLTTVHPGAIAKTCAGSNVTSSGYGGGILSDPRSSEYSAHVGALIANRKSAYSGWDAYFADDSSSIVEANGTPCNFNFSTWLSSTSAAYDQQGVQIIFNGLSDDAYGYDLKPLAQAKSVIAGMWEGCYDTNSGWGMTNASRGLGQKWADVENDELYFSSVGKSFWCFSTSGADPTSGQGLQERQYSYASFLLTYDPRHVYETGYPNATSDKVYPETGIVPTSPLVGQSSSVTTYQKGSVYAREYGACYYRGKLIGACAAVVNPDSTSHPNPLTGYAHALALAGSGVLNGGSASFSASVPPTLNALTGAILIK